MSARGERRFRRGNALAIAAILLLSACGSGTDTETEETPPPVVTDEIVDAAANDGVPTESPPAPAPLEPDPVVPEPEAVEAPGIPADPPIVAEVNEGPAPTPVVDPAAAAPPVAETPGATALLAVDDDPDVDARIAEADAEAGWRVAQRCAACHSLAIEEPGHGASETGPPLARIFGAVIGTVDGFEYSPAMAALAETGVNWTAARLDAFIAAPRDLVPGTAMDIAGIDNPADRANVIAFLIDLAAAAELQSAAVETVADRIAAANPETGERLATQYCGGCHTFGEDGGTGVGPGLYDIVGAPLGRDDGFTYSPALAARGTEGATWTYALLDSFIASPAATIPGTRMGFVGLGNPSDRAAVIAFLRQLSPEPAPLLITIGIPVPEMVAATFAAEQAERGAEVYVAAGCGDCHGADLGGDIDISGFGDAPALFGPTFERRWFAGDIFALWAFVANDKGLVAEETWTVESVSALVAFLLRTNGFRAGSAELPVQRSALETMGFFQ